MRSERALVALVLGLLTLSAHALVPETVVDVPTRGVTQRFLHLQPANPVANLILLPGGDGILRLRTDGTGEMEDQSRIGSIYHTRGIVAGIITAEGIRNAQARFGKGKPMTGEQVRWGIENLNIDEKRLKELGATGLMQPLKVSCMDHEGGGAVKFLQWDGRKWTVITDWIAADQSLVRPMIEASAAQYAKEKGITPRDCSKEK